MYTTWCKPRKTTQSIIMGSIAIILYLYTLANSSAKHISPSSMIIIITHTIVSSFLA